MATLTPTSQPPASPWAEDPFGAPAWYDVPVATPAWDDEPFAPPTPPAVRLISFAFTSPRECPAAHVQLDVRELIYDPSHHPEWRDLNGLDTQVAAWVMTSKRAVQIAEQLYLLADSLDELRSPDAGPVVIAIGCTSGRHTSVALCEYVAKELTENGVEAEAEHLELQLAPAAEIVGDQR